MIGLIRRLSLSLPNNAFIRPYLDYGDISYNKPGNYNFQNKFKKVQYRAWLAITGGIQGTFRERHIHQLKVVGTIRQSFFYKTVNCLLPDYLYSYLDFSSEENYLLRSSSASIIRPLPIRTRSFKATFFPYCIKKRNKLKVSKGLGMLSQLTSLKNIWLKRKKKTRYFLFMIHEL